MKPKLFSELGLSAEVLKAIARLGFEQASPIQAEAIPVLLSGRDVVGQSQTGSGKTAAFAIPAIEKTDLQLNAAQVLVLCPTRELAVQVSEEFHKLALFKRGLVALPIYGGQSYERQFYGLKQGAQIVIGTPGRLMDHLERGTLRLDRLRMIILDEADVMLDMGFRDDIEKILRSVPAERQTVFFAATLPKPIQQLIETFARHPQNVEIERKTLTVPTVEQLYYEVDRRSKVELLTRLIDIHDLKRGIIFCNTKRMVDDLVEHLEAQGYLADRLHGDMSQAQRDRVMIRFRKSGLEFLVATDVAARGIDVDDLEVVFNYDLPYDVEDYVHRIGRTGRAGRSGRAISFASGREIFLIRNIERYANVRIHRGRAPTLQEVGEARSGLVLNKVRTILQSGRFTRQDHLVERLLEEGFNSTDIASALLHVLQEGDESPPSRPTREARSSQTAPGPAHVPERGAERERDRDPDRGRPQPRISQGFEDRERRPRREEPKPTPSLRETVAPASARGRRFDPDRPRWERTPSGAGGPATPRSGVDSRSDRPAAARPQAPPTATPRVEKVPPSAVKSSREAPAAVRAEAERDVARQSRGAQAGTFTRLHMNIGADIGIEPADITRAIMGETGLPARYIGRVDLREKHLFVDVAAEHAPAIIARLKRAGVSGRRVKIKMA